MWFALLLVGYYVAKTRQPPNKARTKRFRFEGKTFMEIQHKPSASLSMVIVSFEREGLLLGNNRVGKCGTCFQTKNLILPADYSQFPICLGNFWGKRNLTVVTKLIQPSLPLETVYIDALRIVHRYQRISHLFNKGDDHPLPKQMDVHCTKKCWSFHFVRFQVHTLRCHR